MTERAAAPPMPRVTRWLSANTERALSAYRPAPAIGLLPAGADRDEALRRWRWRMFVGFFLGYAILYFGRKNISVALPVLGRDLGYTNVQLGLIGTSLYVTYGLGKFLNGVMADRSNIRVFMATGLILSGVLNIVFGTLGSLIPLAFCWGINGWFQSMGFPPIARGMTLWYPPKGKATRWAFWTCSHQAGTAVIIALTGWILTWGTWHYCFWLPGAACILGGLGILFTLGDTPESVGLPSEQPFGAEHTTGLDDATQASHREVFIRHVLTNRNVWVIGFIDLFVYVVRFGTLDWATKYLIEAKGYSMQEAAGMASVMPLAGIIAVLSIGVISDVVFGSRYRTVNALSLLALAGAMYGLLTTGPGSPMLDLFFLAAIGFSVEGPQSLLGGVSAIDAAGSARVASAAAGLVGVLSYFGASLSGVGTGWFIDHYRWSGAFGFWIFCAIAGFLLCFLWREQR